MVDEIKQYINNQIALAKIEVVEKTSSAFASLVYTLFILLFAFIFFLLLVIVCAFWFSNLTGSYIIGFSCASGLFLLLILIFSAFKNGIKRFFRNIFIRKSFESQNKKLDYE